MADESDSWLLSPSEVWAMLQLQRGLIALFATVVILVAFVFTMLAPRKYSATATIHMTPFAGQELKVEAVDDHEQQYTYDSEPFYRTQFELMRSRSLLEEVVQRYEGLGYTDLKLDDHGADSLRGMVSVTQRTNSELVDVTVVAGDPDEAAVLANLVTDVYRERNLDARRQSAQEAKTWLKAQIAEYEQRVRDESQAILDYQSKHDLADADEDVTQLTAKMNALNQAYGDVDTQRVLFETTLREHEKLLRDGQYVDLAHDIDTPVLHALLDDYSKVVSENAQLAARYGERHPERQFAEGQIASLEEQLQRETSRAVEGERARLRELESKSQSLLAEVEASKANLLERQKVHDEYTRMRKDLEQTEAWYAKLTERNDELDMTAQTQLNNVQPVDRARSNPSPVSPNVSRNLVLAVLTGVLGGAMLGFLREYLDDTIGSRQDVETYLQVSFLGLVPMIAGMTKERDKALFTQLQPTSAVAEAVRALRTVLEVNPTGASYRRLLLTSCVSSEGKTSTAVALAISFANLGRRVVLVDCDLRRPRVHQIFDCPKEVGVSSVLGGTPLAEAIQSTFIPNLDILPAGMSTNRPNEIMSSQAMSDLLDQLSAMYDLVLLDTPPSGMVSDATALSKLVDGVIFVVREHMVSRALVQDVIRRLKQVGAPVLGAVINAVDLSGQSGRYNYYYGYRYRYDKYYVEPKSDIAAK